MLPPSSILLREGVEEQEDTAYIWELGLVMGPRGEELLFPSKPLLLVDVRRLLDPSYREGLRRRYGWYLVYADKEGDMALRNFRERRVGWEDEEWDHFIHQLYPTIVEHIMGRV